MIPLRRFTMSWWSTFFRGTCSIMNVHGRLHHVLPDRYTFTPSNVDPVEGTRQTWTAVGSCIDASIGTISKESAFSEAVKSEQLELFDFNLIKPNE